MNHLGVFVCAVVSAAGLRAQLNLLTLRESENVLEQIPDIVAAQRRGECPDLSPAYNGPDELTFQVRTTCGPGRGMLIGSYVLNRRTGEVTLWVDNPQSVADAGGKALARALVAEAQKRILSNAEATCLALEGAKGLPGWSASDAIVSVKPFGKAAARTVQFTATRVSSARPTESGRMLTVDLAAARVRDDETGLDIISTGLGSLTAKLIDLRTPLWLSDEDAISIALLVPRISRRLQDGCIVVGGGAPRANQTIFGVSCAGRTIEGLSLYIDLRTGQPTDPETGESLGSAETARLARERLGQIEQRRNDLRRAVEAHCK